MPDTELFARGRLLLGDEGLARLARSRVAVCGLGGVGSYAAEALARSGVGALVLVDFDRVALSNINRQLCALHSTVEQYKAEVTAARLRDVNPACAVTVCREFLDMDNAAALLGPVDYICDAIDHVPGKVGLIRYALAASTPVISAMGAGRRLDPTQLAVADISATHTCPLARTMRRELKQWGIESGVPVVFSKESPAPQLSGEAIGSLAFVPAAMGMTMASVIVRQLAGLCR